MAVSLFTASVARGAELPVIDPRTIAQPESTRVEQNDLGSAASDAAEPLASNPDAQPDSVSNDGSPLPNAPDGSE